MHQNWAGTEVRFLMLFFQFSRLVGGCEQTVDRFSGELAREDGCDAILSVVGVSRQ